MIIFFCMLLICVMYQSVCLVPLSIKNFLNYGESFWVEELLHSI